MTAKEYLLQAHYLDERITSKTQQIASLNELATRCTSTISDMPKSPNRGGSRMEDCIIKIIDLEDKLKEDIEKLINLKQEIMEVIRAVPNIEYQTLLEKRYLCFNTWEQISVDMCHAIFIKLDEADWQADTTDERLKHKAVFAKAMSIINVK